ncbi:MAG: hypothetical protein PWQ37_904 [Candidatus Petromonas sp.]|jgi:hypothetical protein|nr:hypothetical protein [Candidatus Petromonas sp.]
MLFPDYTETKTVYHIISIIDLDKTLKYGIKFNDKKTYKSKYYEFHDFIDKHKSENIPPWVIRKKAIFGSLNFSKDHSFHSHTAILGIKVDPDRCWIANENLANHIYEPFILQDVEGYKKCRDYLQSKGKEILKKYWQTSLSFKENMEKRYDMTEGYDSEVLILHDIKPKDIDILYIISDHSMLTEDQWRKHFCKI